MENKRTSYSMEEKMELILDILSKKTTIQKVSQEKGISATLLSLWKKQAVDAMEARFRPQPRGRKPVAAAPVAAPTELKSARKEARAAKTKATRLESSLREARAKLAALEEQLQTMAATMGCMLVKERKPRGPRKPGKA